MDRLSPLSYDSGIDSIPSSITPTKKLGHLLVELPAPGSPATGCRSAKQALPEATEGTVEIPSETTVVVEKSGGLSLEPNSCSSSSNSSSGVPEAAITSEKQVGDDAIVPKQTFRQCSENSDVSCDAALPLEQALLQKVEEPISEEPCSSQPSTSRGASAIPTIESSTSLPELLDTEEPELQCTVDDRRYFSCGWNGCTDRLPTFDDVYDHVISIHIESIRLETSIEEEDICCQWDCCGNSYSRGDRQKKVTWLFDHFRSRHAKYARVHKCLIENCGARFASNHRLEEHVRTEHINKKKKVKAPPPPKEETWYTMRLQPLLIKKETVVPVWSRFYSNQLQERICIARELDWNIEIMPRRRPGVGAAHRKAYYPCIEDVVPKKKLRPEEEVSVEAGLGVDSDADCPLQIEKSEHLKLSLTDLFPGWDYEEKRAEREKLENEMFEREKAQRRVRKTRKRKKNKHHS